MAEEKYVAPEEKFEPVKFNPEEKKEEPGKSVLCSETNQIDLNALKNLDPELSKLCAELDLDGDGTINAAELTRACSVIRETRDESAEWQKAAFRRLIAIVALLAINLVLIGTVTYYIVWSTAAVRVDENGNLVNFHEDEDGEQKPAPVVTEAYTEEKSGLNDLFESTDYNLINFLSYSDDNGAQFLRPQGFSVFGRSVDVDGTSTLMDVVVVYVDGGNAVVVENPVKEPYVADPMKPYSISGVTFGEVSATSTQLKSSFSSSGTLRRLAPRRSLKGKAERAAHKKAEKGTLENKGAPKGASKKEDIKK